MAVAHKESDPYNTAQLPSASTHIRLLHISPSGRYDPEAHRQALLICRFSLSEIASPAPYKALSYVWGDTARPWPCWVSLSGMQLPVTLSLDTAMRYLRHQTETTTVWIDQLCINQADNDEKSDQILLMAEVYGKADEVLVWVGAEAEDSDAVMDAFHNVGHGAMELDMFSYYTREKLPILTSMLRTPSPDPADKIATKFRALQDEACQLYRPILRPMGSWFSRDYFTRIWVVQEFALGVETTFVCGAKRVSSLHVILAMQILKNSVARIGDFSAVYKDLQPLINEPGSAFFGAWRRRQKFRLGSGEGDGLFNLLKSMHTERNQMGAFDERDRVYGLMGLAVDVGKLGIKPDYANSTYESVMIETANAIARTGRVELLSYSQHPRVDRHLPSWVPDWRPTLKPSYYTIRENAEPHLFFASGATTTTILQTTDPRILGLEGYTIDTIEQLGSPWWDDFWEDSRYLAFLSQVRLLAELSLLKANPIYATPARRAEAVWRVPIADLFVDLFDTGGGTQRGTPQAKAAYEACLDLCEFSEQKKLITPREWEDFGAAKEMSMVESENRYGASMLVANGMRPFVTVKGYLGLAATAARAGDVVVVFKGARIPYVVRPAEGERRFQFIGEAYCDGMMDGEALEHGTTERFYLV